MIALAPLLLGPWSVPAPTPVAQDELLFSLWIEDAAACLTDPKDARLVEALRLIDDRVIELPAELPGFPPLPPEAIQLAAHVLTGRKSVRVLASDDPSLMVPFYGQLDLLEEDPEQAGALAASILELARSAGVPLGEPDLDGLVPVHAPVDVPIRMGARGSNVVLSVGRTIDEPPLPDADALPPGARPALAMHLDLGLAFETLGGLMALGAPEEADQLLDFAEASGLHGMVVDLVLGMDAERSYTVTRMPGYAAILRDIGTLPVRGLEASDVALVPADATWASVGTYNAQGTLEMVLSILSRPLAEEGLEDPIEALAAMTGFHLRADLVDYLGPVYGAYSSDTTGGGGLLSLVVFLEITDADGMLGTVEMLQGIVDRLGSAKAKGYVGTRSWEMDGADLLSVVFPGIPIPAEPTLAVTPRHLVIGMTPQATLAALEHMGSGGQGLQAHESFTSELPASVEGAYAVTWADTPRLAREGYGLTSLLCSAIANGTRSPKDAGRDGGVVLPSFHELVKGARPAVGLTRVIGDDMLIESRGDGSLLVNVAGGIGMLSASPVGILVPLAIGGAFVGARQEAMRRAEWEYLEAEPVPDGGYQDR